MVMSIERRRLKHTNLEVSRAGKHRQESVIPGTRFDNNKLYQDRYWHVQYFNAVERLARNRGKQRALAGQSGA